MKIVFALIAMYFVLVTVGCSKLDHSISENDIAVSKIRLQLSGSSTVGPLAAEIAKRYEDLHPEFRIDVQTGGSSRGIADARNGLADIGMSSRTLKESELTGRESWPIAMDGVCFIVNASNPVEAPTKSEIEELIKGKINNWQQLGGSDSSVVFINRAAGRSELELVTKFFNLKPGDFEADLIAGENQQGIKMVASTPNAISYMSVGASEDAINRGAKIRMLPLQGVAASVSKVEDGQFPLSRPLIFVTGENPSEPILDFIRFAQSAEVHDLIRELSYVPIPN